MKFMRGLTLLVGVLTLLMTAITLMVVGVRKVRRRLTSKSRTPQDSETPADQQQKSAEKMYRDRNFRPRTATSGPEFDVDFRPSQYAPSGWHTTLVGSGSYY